MKLYTVATHNEGYFDVLKESAERNGLELKVLGWGQKWQGFTWRLHLMLDALSKETPDEIIMFVDAFDVIITQPSTEIERRFKSMNVPYLFSTEHSIFADFRDKFAYNIYMDTYKLHLNAGVYIGYSDMLKILLLNVMSHRLTLPNATQQEDQAIIIGYFNKYPNKAYVDKYSQFSITTFLGDEYLIINNKIVSSHSLIEPVVIHCPAGLSMDTILIIYGYKLKETYHRNKLILYASKVDYIKMLLSH